MIDVKIEQSVESNSAKYPYLGEFKDKTMIVLFTEKDTGFVIEDTDGGYLIGHRSSNWAEEQQFTPFKGSITLSNK